MIPKAPVFALFGLGCQALLRESTVRIMFLRFVFPVSAGAFSPPVLVSTQFI